jgi:enoyl-CoA hydratase
MSTVRAIYRNLSLRPPVSFRKFSDGAPTVYTIENVAYPRKQKNVASLNCKTISTLEVAGNSGVYTVSLNRPSRGNAFNMQMWYELQETFQAADGDHSVRAIVLTGNSVSFSTGMDLSVFSEMQKLAKAEPCEGRKREALSNFIQFLQDAISAPEVCAVPVIAAISGHCIGGAVDLITACDMRYCTDNSTFCVKETDLAMVADIGTLQRLPKLIGDQQTRELTYTGRTISGIEAQSLGLVLKSFATEELMRQHVDTVARAIAEKSPLTIR